MTFIQSHQLSIHLPLDFFNLEAMFLETLVIYRPVEDISHSDGFCDCFHVSKFALHAVSFRGYMPF